MPKHGGRKRKHHVAGTAGPALLLAFAVAVTVTVSDYSAHHAESKACYRLPDLTVFTDRHTHRDFPQIAGPLTLAVSPMPKKTPRQLDSAA